MYLKRIKIAASCNKHLLRSTTSLYRRQAVIPVGAADSIVPSRPTVTASLNVVRSRCAKHCSLQLSTTSPCACNKHRRGHRRHCCPRCSCCCCCPRRYHQLHFGCLRGNTFLSSTYYLHDAITSTTGLTRKPRVSATHRTCLSLAATVPSSTGSKPTHPWITPCSMENRRVALAVSLPSSCGVNSRGGGGSDSDSDNGSGSVRVGSVDVSVGVSVSVSAGVNFSVSFSLNVSIRTFNNCRVAVYVV